MECNRGSCLLHQYSGCTCADSFASTYYVPVPPHTVVIVVISFARFTVQYHLTIISFAAVSGITTTQPLLIVLISFAARLLCHCHLTTFHSPYHCTVDRSVVVLFRSLFTTTTTLFDRCYFVRFTCPDVRTCMYHY